ncbi:MAG: hypothetical protein KGL39_09115 [Patescibacteria group bacterium]|nr:hypothetical protein [Patescibacteria group bacterium]
MNRDQYLQRVVREERARARLFSDVAALVLAYGLVARLQLSTPSARTTFGWHSDDEGLKL